VSRTYSSVLARRAGGQAPRGRVLRATICRIGKVSRLVPVWHALEPARAIKLRVLVVDLCTVADECHMKHLEPSPDHSEPSPRGEEPQPCKWVTDEDGIFNTDCGQQFYSDDGSVDWARFCCYCGKAMKSLTTCEAIDYGI
jgi:hypothetical protein